MRFSNQVLCVALTGLGAILFGCSSAPDEGHGDSAGAARSGSGSGSTAVGDAAHYCDAVCGRFNECDRSDDLQTCRNACLNANSAVMPKLRGAYVTAVSACMVAKDCATILSGSAASPCSDEARAMLAPSAAGVAFCDAWQSTAAKCAQTLDRGACLELATMYADSPLVAAKACTDKACVDIVGCMEATLSVRLSSSDPNSCRFAYDGECDEPTVCDPGTDTYDC